MAKVHTYSSRVIILGMYVHRGRASSALRVGRQMEGPVNNGRARVGVKLRAVARLVE